MPALSNIIVKKADGTTDVTYTAITGAAGDGSPALFRNNTVGTSPAERPNITIGARWNGPRTARRVDCNFAWPTISTDMGGKKTVSGKFTGMATFSAPQDQDVTAITEAAYQFGNLVAAAIVKASFAEGLAPRG